MLSLREYREPSSRLPDRLPWACLVAPGVVLQKDAIFQRTLAFRGPDLASSLDSELVAASARLNNALRRLGSGWGLFVEAQRFLSSAYPAASWPHPAAAAVDRERRRAFEQAGAHYESSYYLTFTWGLPPDHAGRAADLFYEDGGAAGQGDEQRALERDLYHFDKTVSEVTDILRSVLPEVGLLDDDQTLTYLHSTVSTHRRPVRRPETPAYLDALLPDMPFTPTIPTGIASSSANTRMARGSTRRCPTTRCGRPASRRPRPLRASAPQSIARRTRGPSSSSCSSAIHGRAEGTSRSTRYAIACAAFEPPVCPSTSRVPSVHRRTRAAANGPSNGGLIGFPWADRANPNPSSIGVATTGVRPLRTAHGRRKWSAGSGSGVRPKRRSTGASGPRARSSSRPHRPLRFPRTLVERFRAVRPQIAVPR